MSNLQSIRKIKGLSQNDLAKISGLSRSSICKYESGEKNINKAAAATILILSKVLDCSMEDLIENQK